jgi:xanthine dehydrogenase large subunit
VIIAKDLIGENQIGGIVPMSLCWLTARCILSGQPIAIVLAESEEQARKAAKRITADIEPLPVVTDPRVAAANGDLIVPPKKFVLGDTAAAFANCAHVFEGRTEQNGQEHLYIETQGAYAVPMESGGIRVYSSTQGPTAVQRAVCRVTGLPMHKIEVDVQRLGGGFGGKEDQANAWAGICAVATQITRKARKICTSPHGRYADDRQTPPVFVRLQDRAR